MKEIVPLLQTVLWIMAAFGVLFYFRKEVELIREVLSRRLESGSPVRIGPVEIGELRTEVETVRTGLANLNERVSSLFLTTMSPAMYDNLRKLNSGSFGEYEVSKGLKRELYHLRDIGYIEIESITSIPSKGDDLSDHVKITPTGKAFVEVRENSEVGAEA